MAAAMSISTPESFLIISLALAIEEKKGYSGLGWAAQKSNHTIRGEVRQAPTAGLLKLLFLRKIPHGNGKGGDTSSGHHILNMVACRVSIKQKKKKKKKKKKNWEEKVRKGQKS